MAMKDWSNTEIARTGCVLALGIVAFVAASSAMRPPQPRYTFMALNDGLVIRADAATGEAIACARAKCSLWVPKEGAASLPLFPEQ